MLNSSLITHHSIASSTGAATARTAPSSDASKCWLPGPAASDGPAAFLLRSMLLLYTVIVLIGPSSSPPFIFTTVPFALAALLTAGGAGVGVQGSRTLSIWYMLVPPQVEYKPTILAVACAPSVETKKAGPSPSGGSCWKVKRSCVAQQCAAVSVWCWLEER